MIAMIDDSLVIHRLLVSCQVLKIFYLFIDWVVDSPIDSLVYWLIDSSIDWLIVFWID